MQFCRCNLISCVCTHTLQNQSSLLMLALCNNFNSNKTITHIARTSGPLEQKTSDLKWNWGCIDNL